MILDYAEAAFRDSPILSQLIEARTARQLRLTNRIDIEVRAADFRRLRGLTFICVISDELAFWPTDDASANPDTEILNAIRPGLATTQGPLFLISSPYARRGELWEMYCRHFGPDGDPAILVAQGSSRTFNSTMPQSVVDRAFERDPAVAAAEYGGEFRQDIESFITLEMLEPVISKGVFERQPQRGLAYFAFVDPSAGRNDSMTLAIGHYEANRETAVIDCIREARAPFSPEAVCADFADVLKRYDLARCTGDKVAGAWVEEQFGAFGIIYDDSAAPKSRFYESLLATINSKRCDLPDSPRLMSQLLGLERHLTRGAVGDKIDHASGAMDDVANATAGCVATILAKGVYNIHALADALPDSKDPYGIEGWRKARMRGHVLNAAGAPWSAMFSGGEPRPSQDSRNTQDLASLRASGKLSDVFK